MFTRWHPIVSFATRCFRIPPNSLHSNNHPPPCWPTVTCRNAGGNKSQNKTPGCPLSVHPPVHFANPCAPFPLNLRDVPTFILLIWFHPEELPTIQFREQVFTKYTKGTKERSGRRMGLFWASPRICGSPGCWERHTSLTVMAGCSWHVIRPSCHVTRTQIAVHVLPCLPVLLYSAPSSICGCSVWCIMVLGTWWCASSKIAGLPSPNWGGLAS